MKGRKISVLINSDKIIRIVGDLTEFEVYGEGFVLLCGENLDVRLFGLEPEAEEAARTGG